MKPATTEAVRVMLPPEATEVALVTSLVVVVAPATVMETAEEVDAA